MKQRTWAAFGVLTLVAAWLVLTVHGELGQWAQHLAGRMSPRLLLTTALAIPVLAALCSPHLRIDWRVRIVFLLILLSVPLLPLAFNSHPVVVVAVMVIFMAEEFTIIPFINRRGLPIALAFLVATLFVAPQIHAQTAPQPTTGSSSAPPPELKPELQPLASFVGQWDCAGEFMASKKPIAAHLSVSPDLDGSWLIFRWDDKAPNRFHAVEFWGYNKTAKHFSNFIYDNFGGARLFESKGMDADTLIWAGDMLPSASGAETQINQRFVLERKSAKEFVISYDTRKPQADWSTMDRLNCKQ